MNKTNVKANPSTTHRHDTPNNKTHIIKFRVTETEKMELQCTAKLLHLSLSTLIRRGWSYVSTTRRSFAPQGANMSRVWGRHAPTRSHQNSQELQM